MTCIWHIHPENQENIEDFNFHEIKYVQNSRKIVLPSKIEISNFRKISKIKINFFQKMIFHFSGIFKISGKFARFIRLWISTSSSIFKGIYICLLCYMFNKIYAMGWRITILYIKTWSNKSNFKLAHLAWAGRPPNISTHKCCLRKKYREIDIKWVPRH